MKQLFFAVAAFALMACGSQPKAEQATVNPAENENLPTILREHPQLAEFTLLQQEKPEQIDLLADASKYHFFNEKDGKEVNPDLFKVENGVINMDGEAGGYFMVDGDYKNYYLRCQVKWGSQSYGKWAQEPKNGGIQYHVPADAEDKLWPSNYEYEIMVGAIGELWTGRPFTTTNDTLRLGGSYFRVYATDKTQEKADSVWNVCEMICFDNKIEHYINGVKVLEATVPEEENHGKFNLQYEYTDIQYKDLVMIPLK